MSPLQYKFQNYFGQSLFAIIFLGTLAFANYVLWPLGTFAFDKLVAEIKTYQSIQQLKESSAPTDSLLVLKDILEKSEKVIKAVPSESRGSFVLGKILESAKAADLEIADLNSLDEVSHKGYLEYPLELSVKGEYPRILKLIHSLESESAIFGIRHVKMETTAINKPEVTAFLEVSAYVLTHVTE